MRPSRRGRRGACALFTLATTTRGDGCFGLGWGSGTASCRESPPSDPMPPSPLPDGARGGHRPATGMAGCGRRRGAAKGRSRPRSGRLSRCGGTPRPSQPRSARCGRSTGKAAPGTGSAAASRRRGRSCAHGPTPGRSGRSGRRGCVRGRAARRGGRSLGEIVDVAGRARGDPPAGRGGARLGRAGLAEEEAHHPAFAGAERKPPAGGEVERPRVAANSQSTAASPAQRSPSSNTQSASSGRRVATTTSRGRVEAELAEAGAVGTPALPGRGLLEDEQDRPLVARGEAGEQRHGEAGRGGDLPRGSAARIS